MFRLRNQRLLAEGAATAFGGVDPQSLDRRSRLERQRGAPDASERQRASQTAQAEARSARLGAEPPKAAERRASAPRTPRRVDAQPSYAESDLGGGSC
jgi:hypothetical protein